MAIVRRATVKRAPKASATKSAGNNLEIETDPRYNRITRVQARGLPFDLPTAHTVNSRSSSQRDYTTYESMMSDIIDANSNKYKVFYANEKMGLEQQGWIVEGSTFSIGHSGLVVHFKVSEGEAMYERRVKQVEKQIEDEKKQAELSAKRKEAAAKKKEAVAKLPPTVKIPIKVSDSERRTMPYTKRMELDDNLYKYSEMKKLIKKFGIPVAIELP
jgi:hypothetical protein